MSNDMLTQVSDRVFRSTRDFFLKVSMLQDRIKSWIFVLIPISARPGEYIHV